MDAPGQAIRASCDRCYKKKVRCEISENAAKCDRCLKKGDVECVFSPPGRNGRPPRASSSNDEERRAAPAAQNITPKPPRQAERRPVAPPSPPRSTNNNPPPPPPQIPQHTQPLPMQTHELPTNSYDTDFGLFTESDLYNDSGSLGFRQDFGQDNLMTNNDDLMQFLQTPVSPIDPFENQEVQQQPADEEAVFGGFEYDPIPQVDPFQQLQTIQQRLVEYSICGRDNSAAAMSGSRGFDAGNLFELIEELHIVIQRCLDGDARGESSLDFNTAMTLATTIGNAVKIYEMLADCTASVMDQSGPGRPKRQRTTSETSSAGSRSSDNFWKSSSSSSASSGQGSPNYTIPQIRINAFVTSSSFSQLVMAQQLLVQLQDMRGLIEQLQQRLIQRETSIAGGGGGRFLMPEMNVTIIQLLNQMQMRISRLEPVAMDVLANARDRRRSSLVKS